MSRLTISHLAHGKPTASCTFGTQTTTHYLIPLCDWLAVQERTVHELEVTVKQQSAEVEKGKALRQKLTQEKGQLEIQVATLGAELQEASRRYGETGGYRSRYGTAK